MFNFTKKVDPLLPVVNDIYRSFSKLSQSYQSVRENRVILIKHITLGSLYLNNIVDYCSSILGLLMR